MARSGNQRHSTKYKQRKALYDHWRLEILRNAVDPATLERVRQRALHDRNVRNDPGLLRQIEEYIHSHSAELTRLGLKKEGAGQAQAGAVYGRKADGVYAQSPEDVLATQRHLEAEIRRRLAHFDEVESAFLVSRLQSLQQEHPDLVDADQVARIGARVEALRARRLRREAEIETLADDAASAAEVGDHETSASILKRLSGIHLAHPDLLPEEQLRQIRRRIVEASEHHEHREAATALVDRERAVAEELRQLADSIHAYHRVARMVPHDSDEYRKAEAEYARAVGAVRHHDKEWLAGTILELVDLLAEWEDHPPDAEVALDQFVREIKVQLKRLLDEIRQIEEERRHSDG